MFRAILLEFIDVKGLTQTDIAKKLGVSQSGISDFLKSTGNVRASTKRKYFKALSGLEDFFMKKVSNKNYSGIFDFSESNVTTVQESSTNYYNSPELTEEEVKIIEKFKGITMQELAWFVAYKEKDLLRVRNFNLWLRVKQQESVIKILKES